MDGDFQQLLDHLDHPNLDVRVAAIQAIGQWDATHSSGRLTACAVPHLARALHAAEREARWSAAYALGALGYAEGVPALVEALDAAGANGDTGLRLVIVKALGKIESSQSVPVLQRVRDEAETRCLRIAAEKALARRTAQG